MQLQTTSPKTKFPIEFIDVISFKSLTIWESYCKKYEGVPILWIMVYFLYNMDAD